MKSIVTFMAAGGLLAALAMAAPPSYTLKDLGPVGQPAAQPYFITNNGLIGGAAVSSGKLHAALWYKEQILDIGQAGLNSAAYGVNERGQFVGATQTSAVNDEDFCGFNFYGFPSTPKVACLPFLWQNYTMNILPTLGGPNGVANMINSRGDAVGWAENTTKDAGCPVHQFKPVIWSNGKIETLPTYSNDQYGVAAQINDSGQVVGASGDCAGFNPGSGLYMLESHALLWDKGTVHNLPTLLGKGTFGGHHACALNNKGEAVGHSDILNDATFHAVLWTNTTSILDLKMLPGPFNFASAALGINEKDQVVGSSFDAGFNGRAFIWENGAMTALNDLIPANSDFDLQFAVSINARGEIAGLAQQKSTGQFHGFLATPSN